MLTRRAPESRQINYLARLLTEDSAAKEIKLFNLGDTLLGRYMSLFDKFFQEDKALARRRALAGFSLGLITTAGFYGSYAWIVLHTVQGKISLGDMTLYLAIFRQGQTTFQSILSAIGNIYENNLFMAHFFEFLGLQPQLGLTGGDQKLPVPLRGGIEFRGVGFCYPENGEWALRGYRSNNSPRREDRAGRAQRGRQDDPDQAPEPPLRSDRRHDPARRYRHARARPIELQKRIGVIFQDFVRYHLPVEREHRLRPDRRARRSGPRSSTSARKSGADAVIESLPEGYETMLGRWFHGGHELSLGQWQKIALARAFMRDAEMLVLDEPTAVLDAATEYEIFRALPRAHRGKHGDPDLPPLLHRAHGRPHRCHRGRPHRRARHARGTHAPGRNLRAPV